MRLEQFYVGDIAWNEFVEATRACGRLDRLYDPALDSHYNINTDSGKELFTVAVSYYGRKGIDQWINSPTEMLDGESILSCIIDTKLHNRLREFLIRLP